MTVDVSEALSAVNAATKGIDVSDYKSTFDGLGSSEIQEYSAFAKAQHLKFLGAEGKALGPDSINVEELVSDKIPEWRLLAMAPPPISRMPNLEIGIWNAAIEAAKYLYSEEKPISVQAVCEVNHDLEDHRPVLRELFKDRSFHKALSVRGIRPGGPKTLSARQMMALSVLCDFTDKRALSTKLRKIGIKQWEFDAWNSQPEFRAAYLRLSEKVFERAQAPVNVALSQLAVNGDLPAIKYFNEISGRWNPATQGNLDARRILQAVIEVLTSTIKDPALLREISSKLQLIGSATAMGSRVIEG